MCGIAGLLASFSKGLLSEMSESVVHLGLDDDGLNCGNQNFRESS